MLQDLRFALRLLRKHSGSVGIAIGGLGLAIGCVTAVFSLVNASMLRPYGMEDPGTVVTVGRPDHFGRSGWAYGQFLQLREGSALAAVEASMVKRVRFGTSPADEVARPENVLFVSGEYLSVLGARATRGRALGPADDTPGAAVVAVVSDRFLRTALNNDPAAIGSTIWLNGAPATIVGVLAPEFTGPLKVPPGIWATFATADDVLGGPAFDPTSTNEVEVIARLTPATTMWAAQAQLSGVVKRFSSAGAAPAARASEAAVLLSSAASPMDGPDDAEGAFAIASTFGALSLVLGLACMNAATLLMAAAITRRREIGVRLALGASSRRLLRQMLSESLLLGGIAGGLGFLFALWIAPVLRTAIQMPPEVDISPDGRVLLFTIVVALICGLGCGLSPARYGSGGNVLSALQGGSRSSAVPLRFRTWFVGFQAAMSMLLLVVAAMMARTTFTKAHSEIGLDASRLIGVELTRPSTGFDERTYLHAALIAVRELPGIEGVSMTQNPIFGVSTAHRRVTSAGRSGLLFVTRADADYLNTAGVRVVRGRSLVDADAVAENPVALISESGARALFGDANPIGQLIAQAAGQGAAERAVVVGVVNDTIIDRLHRVESLGALYRPMSEPGPSPAGLLVRTVNPAKAARAIEAALRRIDPRVEPTTWSVGDSLDSILSGNKVLAWLAGPVAVLAFLLAGFGVYGVTSFVVGQRKEEVSVRLAIGASPADITRLVMTDALRPVVVGLVVGLAGALLVTQILARPLSINPLDPVAIAVAALTLLCGGAAAVIVPARRAARTDPAGVLRG